MTIISQLKEQIINDHGVDASLSFTNEELLAFLKLHSNFISKAAKAAVASYEWRKNYKVTIQDVAPYMRCAPGKSIPDGCVVLLEDGKGGCAKDNKGRPIIWGIGLTYGETSQDQINQMAYAIERAALYTNNPGEYCIVIQACDDKTNKMLPTFRTPDASTRDVSDFLKRVYPLTVNSCTIHFCGIPWFVSASFQLCRPFMRKETLDCFVLSSSFKHLHKDKHIDLDNILPRWDPKGSFDFDIDEYIEWRAREENLEGKVCAQGQGNSFENNNCHELNLTLGDVLSNDCENLLQGNLFKKGSGVGIFGSCRWKSKYAVLQPEFLYYFESNDKEAKVSRIIQLNNTDDNDCNDKKILFVEQPVSGNDSTNKHVLKLTTAERDFEFGFETQEAAQTWYENLQQQCK